MSKLLRRIEEKVAKKLQNKALGGVEGNRCKDQWLQKRGTQLTAKQQRFQILREKDFKHRRNTERQEDQNLIFNNKTTGSKKSQNQERTRRKERQEDKRKKKRKSSSL